MNPEIKQKFEAAAQELWAESPELRQRYHHNWPEYLAMVRLRLAAQEEWNQNPSLHQEFGDFNRFLAFKKAEKAGSFKIIGR